MYSKGRNETQLSSGSFQMSKKFTIKINCEDLPAFRNRYLMDGPIKEQIAGTKKGKKGYTRKNKNWKNES
jgi:hypothetical protein